MSDPPAPSSSASSTKPKPASAVGSSAGIDLERSIVDVLSSIPWEGPPAIDPDRTSAGDFFEQL